MRPLLVALVAVLISSAAFAGGPIRDPRGWSDGKFITVDWYGDDESGVNGYVIMRRAGREGSFITLTPAMMPLESDRHYTFVDETAFRTNDTFYVYRIIPVRNGQANESDGYDVSVTHSTSSVRRTWGSIKAMFR